MGETLGLFATVCAFISGSILGSAAFSGYKTSRHKNMMKVLLGSSSIADALSISLESQGMNHRILVYVIELSRRENALPNGLVSLLATNWTSCEKQLRQAGLDSFVSCKGVAAARFRLMLFGGIVGALLGTFLSSLIALIGLIFGGIGGVTAVSRALKQEAQSRSFVAEKHLSQMIEVIILGLKSGMTFDRALSLFYSNFDGALSSSLALAQSQWTHGLIDRSEGLRALARSYDSVLFERLAENIIRSLRFGTSLAVNLSLLASEARAVRKAKLEEKVAKAPVKMLLPVGTLILPAMLILIMGPIMLDLMEGF